MGERSTGEGPRQRNFCTETVSSPWHLACRNVGRTQLAKISLTPGGRRQRGRLGLGQSKIGDLPNDLEVNTLPHR